MLGPYTHRDCNDNIHQHLRRWVHEQRLVSLRGHYHVEHFMTLSWRSWATSNLAVYILERDTTL